MVTEIRLTNSVWSYDETAMLGPPGGFGEVFKGNGAEGEVAVKRLKLTANAAAHRELKLGASLSSRELKNVVPVLDYGQDSETDRYFLVMPICEYSLEQHLADKGQLSWNEASFIVSEVIDGLIEVGDIVHRDMKPGNILWHDARWKIADFGIAKFVADATSLQTLKASLSVGYAAPEQWLLERSTSATDVYALACIIHAMINGSPPFSGDNDAIREGHLNGLPATLSGVGPQLESFVQLMLRKSQGARPSLQRCKDVMSNVRASTGDTIKNALAEAGRKVITKQAQTDAEELSADLLRKAIQQQTIEAITDINAIFKRMLDEIADSSEAVEEPYAGQFHVSLGPAELSMAELKVHQNHHLKQSNWTILAFTEIHLRCQIEKITRSDESEYVISSSIIYAKPPNGSDFRWFELSFWVMSGNSWHQPFSVPATDRHFDIALSNTLGACSVAFGPKPIDTEDEPSFHDRWKSLFARGASGKLRPPRQMPPPDEFYSAL